MNLSAKMFGEEGKQLMVPMPIVRMKEMFLPALASLMQVFGIKQLTLSVKPGHVIPPVSISMATFGTQAKAIEDQRSKVVTSIKGIMEACGLLELVLEPTAEELEKLQQFWNYATDGAIGEQNVPLGLPVPKVIDPTPVAP